MKIVSRYERWLRGRHEPGAQTEITRFPIGHLWCPCPAAGNLIKFFALYEIMHLGLMEPLVALLVIHASSRAVAGSLIFDMPYVRESGKAKPLAQNQSGIDLCILLAFGLLPLCLLSIPAAVGSLIGIITRSWIKHWLLQQLGLYR